MAGSLTNLIYHVVFSTKNRWPLITEEVRKELYDYIGGLIAEKNGHLLEVGGVEGHIHLAVQLRSSASLADIIRFVKTNSSRWMNLKGGPERSFLWQGGYGAFTVSRSRLPQLRHYLQSQAEHHKKKTFREEFTDFLQRHEIEFEEDQLWS